MGAPQKEPSMKVKVLDSMTFEVLAKVGQAMGYNRQLDTRGFKLDPEGWHVVTLSLPHEHINGKAVDPHMRLVMQVKMLDETKPVQLVMDIPWEQWELLPEYDTETQEIRNHDGDLLAAR